MPWPTEHDGTVGMQMKHVYWSKMPMAAYGCFVWLVDLASSSAKQRFQFLPTTNVYPKHINIDLYSVSLLAYIEKNLRFDAWCEFSSVRIVFSRSVYTSGIVYLEIFGRFCHDSGAGTSIVVCLLPLSFVLRKYAMLLCVCWILLNLPAYSFHFVLVKHDILSLETG